MNRIAILGIITLFGVVQVDISEAKSDADLKGEKIIEQAKIGTYSHGDYTIEIIKIDSIHDGVEVFARAWKNEKQVGFGENGTIEIERFRIVNPPIAIRNGYTVKIDPERALRDSLGEIIALTAKPVIPIKGTIGNTTTSVFASHDGRFGKESEPTWSAARDATTADFLQDPSSTGETVIQSVHAGGSNPYWIRRYGLTFDTSSIPNTDIITSATWSLWVMSKSNTDNDGEDYLSITSFSPNNETNYTHDDFDQFTDTELVTSVDYGSIAVGQYVNLSANASGISHIDKAGNTVIFYREGHDITNNVIASNGSNGLNVSAIAHMGTSQDPKLVIEHSASNPNSGTYSGFQILAVGGGGGGGTRGGGGGGGGEVVYETGFPLHSDSYSITVGAGGQGGDASSEGRGNIGGNSSIGSVIVASGGGGGSNGVRVGLSGGSGGGSVGNGHGGGLASGDNTFPGGSGAVAGFCGVTGGGGGGASAAGQNATGNDIGDGGDGGDGFTTSISGVSTTYAGGGGGSVNCVTAQSSSGLGGSGGGGDGGYSGFSLGEDGTINTGGGGGGSNSSASGNAGDGGSGIVIIRWETGALNSYTCGGTETANGGDTICTFTSDGTFTFGVTSDNSSQETNLLMGLGF